jgi:succinyl-diaminopimelate desuccinylase
MTIDDHTKQAILSHIDPDELIRLTADLVRINSVWDPEAGTGEQAAARLVAEWADRQGFDVDMDEVAPGRPNTIVTYNAGSGSRTLMFEGHTDVVTPGDVKSWTYDPFGAVIVGRRMYGRGTNDTKGNLAAMLIAMTALKRSGVNLAGTVIGGVLCDEEGEMLGVRDFIRRGRADHVTGAVICEPQDGLVCIAQKGALRVRCTIEGRMAHGAMPLSGLNTAPAMAMLIQGLHRMEIRAAEKHGRHEYLGWPSFTPTVFRAPAAGPPQLNVIPGQAELLVDIRTIPSQDHDRIRSDIQALVDEVKDGVTKHYQDYDLRIGHHRRLDINIRTEFLTDRPCTRTEPDDPLVLAADAATRDITGSEPVHHGVPGATDGTFLRALKNIPIVTMGAGKRDVPHQKDEWVNLDQLVETTRIYALTALFYLWPAGAR